MRTERNRPFVVQKCLSCGRLNGTIAAAQSGCALINESDGGKGYKMEELKKLFGDKALTYAELEAALQGSKNLKLANLAGGQYVDKAKFAQLETQLAEAKAGREADARAFGDQLNTQKKDAGIALALTQAQAKNLTAARALLRLDDIALEGDTLTGLDAQLEAIRRENPFLFGGAAQNPPPPANGGAGNVLGDSARWRMEAGLPVAGQ